MKRKVYEIYTKGRKHSEERSKVWFGIDACDMFIDLSDSQSADSTLASGWGALPAPRSKER